MNSVVAQQSALQTLRLCSGVIAISFGLFAAQAEAFGYRGHQWIAEHAMQQLTPEAAGAVSKALSRQSIGVAANWADIQRRSGKPAWFWQGDAARWHYLNVDVGKLYQPSTTDPANLYHATVAMLAILQDQPVLHPEVARQVARLERQAGFDKTAFALKWLLHLVGDIHQPLHVAYGFDRGGNLQRIDWHGRRKNLHWLWDTGLIQAMNAGDKENGFQSVTAHKDTPNISSANVSMNEHILQWIHQAQRLLPQIYALPGCPFTGRANNCIANINVRYVERSDAIIQQQSALAAARLTFVLEAISTDR